MKIKVLKILLAIMIFVLFIWYMKNDGIYMTTKLFSSELDMINRYAIYEVEFPRTTIIEKYTLEDDIESYIISHNQYIEATLLVPNEEIEKIVPEFARDYDLEHSLDLRKEKTDEPIQYNVWMPRTVVKWIDKTQRTIHYTVMRPGEKYTRVYLFVDKLGWNLYKYRG